MTFSTSTPASTLFPRLSRLALVISLLVLGLVAATTRAEDRSIAITPDPAHTVYRPGEAVGWTVSVRGLELPEVTYVLKQGGMVDVGRGRVKLTGGLGRIETVIQDPGWYLVESSIQSTNAKPIKAVGGAVVSPESFKPAQPRPRDFDAFWKKQIARLKSIPANPQITPVDIGKPEVEYSKITMDNIGGTHIQGQLAKPTAANGKKLPAMLIVQWAGVYPLQKDWIIWHARDGWLVLDINAHDLPIDEKEEFYRAQSEGPLKDYPAIGNDSRETSYFLRMYLSCYRAAQYLVERPDWDGKTLVVTGGSQGGLQSIVTAAIHPRITALMASVPAGCDLNGPLANRLPGWPMWYNQVRDKDPAKVREAARYFDVVNFAPKVHCAALVGVGLIDTVCPAPGVYAAWNQFKGPKEIVPLPVGEHGEKNGSHAPYNARFKAWREALVHGELPAIPK